MERRAFAMPRQQERMQMRVERQQFRGRELRQAQTRAFERQQFRMNREQAQNRMMERQQFRLNRQEARNRIIERQQFRMNRNLQARNQMMERQQFRMNRNLQAQNRVLERQQLRGDQLRLQQQALTRHEPTRFAALQNGFGFRGQDQFRVNHDFADRFYAGNGRCPPGLWAKNSGCMPPGQAQKLLGAPLSAAAGFATLAALPPAMSYLYPDTPDYYYRYGDGYLYRVDRERALIDSVLPLFGGGYLPGQYLPDYYMSSYVPDYYGFNSFYPDYGNDCYRYGYGVVYDVACDDGMVEDVIPLYAGGYGVGQLLPSAYNYYNVPIQYRPLYYDTADYGYWYSPGAIYQYDRGSSMITSVAALMAPGFTIGQPLPYGYDVYNVPYAYRATYYDSPTAWYRYNNGYIYQVDPVTRLVTAIVASVLNA
jgi:hypothetical protein